MIGQVISLLENNYFKRVVVNHDNMFIYYKTVNEKPYVVLCFNNEDTSHFYGNQYVTLEGQVKKHFEKQGFYNISLLNLIFTSNALEDLGHCTELNNYWIVDVLNNKLKIYENQPIQFLDLKEMIESALYNPRVDSETPLIQPIRRPVVKKQFAIINTLLVLANVLVFTILEFHGDTDSVGFMLMHGASNWKCIVDYHEYYRLFTHMFLHFGISHLVNNMILLAFMGVYLERAVGRWKYLTIYLTSGLAAGLTSMVYNMIQNNNVVSAGASGAIFGVVGAMVFVVFINHGRLEDITIQRLIIFVLLSLYSGFVGNGTDNAAHIGGFIAGIIIAALIYRKPSNRGT